MPMVLIEEKVETIVDCEVIMQATEDISPNRSPVTITMENTLIIISQASMTGDVDIGEMMH